MKKLISIVLAVVMVLSVSTGVGLNVYAFDNNSNKIYALFSSAQEQTKTPKVVKLSAEKYTYNGEVKKPKVIVKNSSGDNVSTDYYSVSYASGRKNVGEYNVKITFNGKYSGTVTKSFKIVPKSTSISKLTSKKKALLLNGKNALLKQLDTK